MLNTGIYNLQQLTGLKLDSFLGCRKRILISLYSSLKTSGIQDSERLQQLVLLNFTTAGGVYKRTCAERFFEFDKMVSGICVEKFSGKQTIQIHDMGVSDGRTSVDFYKVMANVLSPGAVSYLATDITPYVDVLTESGNKLSVVIDPEEKLVQFCRPPFVCNVAKPERILLFPVNRFVCWYFKTFKIHQFLERYKKDTTAFSTDRIDLVCDSFKQIMEQNPSVNFDGYNLLQPIEKQFDIVRAMNVLNPGYFNNDQLQIAIGHVFDSLNPGGLFITGRNQTAESVVDGSVFIKTDKRFEIINSMGNKSPIEALVRNYKA